MQESEWKIEVKEKLYFTTENADVIEGLLEKVQKRARTRCMDAESALSAWEKNPIRRATEECFKTELKGTKATIHSDWGALPQSYRGYPDSTKIDLEHDGRGWRVMCVRRDGMATRHVGAGYGIAWTPSEKLSLTLWGHFA